VLEGVEFTLKEPLLALRGPLLALSEPVLVLLESASVLDTVFWSHEAIAFVLSKTLVVWVVDVRRSVEETVVTSMVETLVDVIVVKADEKVTVIVLVVLDRNGTPSGRPIGGPGGSIFAGDSTDHTIRWFLAKVKQLCRIESMHVREVCTYAGMP